MIFGTNPSGDQSTDRDANQPPKQQQRKSQFIAFQNNQLFSKKDYLGNCGKTTK